LVLRIVGFFYRDVLFLGSEWMMRLACYDTTYLVNLVNIRGHAAPVSNLGGTPLLLVDLCLQKIHIITVR
jgi:hypothetical protein